MTSLMMKCSVVVMFMLVGFCVWSCKCEGSEEIISVIAAPMEQKEKDTLYLAVQGFVGNWWNGSDLFPDPCGWTPIEGVVCDLIDGLWYVSTLNFGPSSENSLQCAQNVKFSWRYLFELNHLTTLSFANCFLHPTQIPVEIPTSSWEKLSNTLQYLEFRSNPGLVGTIPSTLGQLYALESLLLLENGLSGELPPTLGNLVNLKRLVLAGNQFSGQIPSSIGGLSKLLIFDSSRNSLSGSLPLTVGGLTSLLKLDLSNNLLQGQLPQQIGWLKKLTLLDLGHNNLSNGLIQELEEMGSIESMVLSNNPLMGGDLMKINWNLMENLEILDLSNMGIFGEIPKSMEELKNLRFLGLNNNKLTGPISANLSNLPKIAAFYIYGNDFTGEIEFPYGFYEKLGRRFGAWNNSNLCYSVFKKLGFNDEDDDFKNVPFGVKLCQTGNSNKGNSIPSIRRDGNLGQHVVVASFGTSGFCCYDEFLWVLWGRLFVFALICNFM